MAFERLGRRERVRDRQVWQVVARPQAHEQRLHLDVRVHADHRDVDLPRRARLVARVDLAGKRVDGTEAALAQELPRLLEVVVAPLHHEVEHVLDLGGAKLPVAHRATRPAA